MHARGLFLGIAWAVGVAMGCYEPAASEGAADSGTSADDSTVGADTKASADTQAGADSMTSGDSTTGDTGCRCGDPGCCPGVMPVDCCPGATCPVVHQAADCGSYFFCGPLGTPGNAATYSKAMAQQASKACLGTPHLDTGTCIDIIKSTTPTVLHFCFGYAGSIAGSFGKFTAGDGCCGSLTSDSGVAGKWN